MGPKKLAVVFIALALIVGFAVGCGETATKTTSNTTTTKPKETPKAVTPPPVDPATYKASCVGIEFRVLNKSPETYKGTKYCTTGEVIQIMEGATETDIRLNVTQSEYGNWSDTIYVAYTGKLPNVFEDSVINVWGEIRGSYSYKATSGWDITLPLVLAQYVEVVTP